MPVGELLHHRVDALGLLQGIVDDLLQIDAVAGSLREVMALLLELVHIEHQRRQRPIEFTRDGGCGFLGRPGARGRERNHFRVVCGCCADFGPLGGARITCPMVVMRHGAESIG